MQVKPGIRNFLVIGVMAMLFILMAKVIFNKYPVQGLTQMVNTI